MKTPDRFARTVEDAVCLPGVDVLTTTLAIRLLRAEHKAVVLLVKTIQRWKPEHTIGAMTTDMGGDYVSVVDLLRALKARRDDE